MPPRRSCSPQARAEQGLKFKAMYRRLGFGATDVANFLQVTPRTVQLWVSGRVRIPYSAYKLLRVLLHYELPGKAWDGWALSAGRLYTPEGHELNPVDFTWWSLLVRKAAMFGPLYAKTMGAGRTAPGPVALACDAQPAPARSGPTDAVGRPAQPAGLNSFLEHFIKRDGQNPANMRVPARSSSDVHVNLIPSHEKEATMAKKRRIRSRRTGTKLMNAEVAGIVQETRSKQRREGTAPLVGSPLLRGLLGRSEAVTKIAADIWAEVTDGAGVVLVNGKPVDQRGGA